MPGNRRPAPLTSRAMSSQHRAVAAALVGVACLVLAGCGDNDAAAGDSPVEVRETSYAMVEPEPTTTTLAGPVVTTLPPEGAIDPNEQIHTIVSGDSLYGIAARYGITLDVLVQYNTITGDPAAYLLVAGETLRIPPNSKVPGTGSAATGSGSDSVPPETEPAGEPCTYTIEPGDNPSRVAEDYGISFNILQAANPEHNFLEWFKVGETIRIPAGADGCDN